jgi:hypothetical protein
VVDALEAYEPRLRRIHYELAQVDERTRFGP